MATAVSRIIICALVVLAILPAPARAQVQDAGPSIVAVEAIIGGPSPLDAFLRPQYITAAPDLGFLIVADAGNHRLVTFDLGWRSRGSLTYHLRMDRNPAGTPKAVAIDPRGRLLVVDDLARDVEVMNWRGSHIAYLRPIFPAELSGRVDPVDVRVGDSGRIYMLYGGDRPGVVVLDPDGSPVTSIGFGTVEDGPFTAPVSLAVDDTETRIAVVDAMAERAVMVFDVEGRPLAAFGEHAEGEGTVSVPVHATWGPGGTLWVTDNLRHSIGVYTADGAWLGRIGGFGDGPGQFRYPIGAAFLADDRIAVLERAGARCQVLEIALPELPNADPELEQHHGPGAAGT